MAISKEQLLDRISILLIENFSHPNISANFELKEWQQAVVSGSIKYNTEGLDEIVMFGSDVYADSEDAKIIEWLHNYFTQNNLGLESLEFVPSSLQFRINGQALNAINPDFNSITLINNFSQYIDFDETHKNIDTIKAQEILDTEIFELLPSALSRQQQINKFFSDYESLKGSVPPYELDNDGNDELDTMTDPTAAVYSGSHDISAFQNQGIDDSESFITRLNKDANTLNSGKTLEFLRDDLNEYLKDIDASPETEITDDRPIYENVSSGYLKIRHLNQGLIIRRQEGDDIGVEKLVKVPDSNAFGPNYIVNGFTISLWVKFLDRVNKGTLFNYGNPMRLDRPKGFKLETFTLFKEDPLPSRPDLTWGSIAPAGYFSDNDYERFIRLIVRDPLSKDELHPKGKLYDSHLGMEGFPYDRFIPEFGYGADNTTDYRRGNEEFLFTHTRVPIDFDEWFFVVASFDPNINDIGTGGDFEENKDYWTGNIVPTGDTNNIMYTHKSNYGAKCKVEIISKSDLVRARGFKLEEE